MASEQVLSLRVTDEFKKQYTDYVDTHFGDARGATTVAMFDALNAQMNGGAAWLNQAHADQKMLIAELEREVGKLKLLTGKPITDKPRAMWPHSRKCANVYAALAVSKGLTSYELSHLISEPPNNCATRLKELASSGYVDKTGEKRKGERYMLDEWRVTSKTYLGL